MTKGPGSSMITAATRAVDVADRAMATKHRMRLRATYRSALHEILGPGVFEEIDLKCEDLLDSMISNMAERAGQPGGRADPGEAGLTAIETVLKSGPAPFQKQP